MVEITLLKPPQAEVHPLNQWQPHDTGVYRQVAGGRERWGRRKEKPVVRFLYFQDVKKNQHKITPGFVLQNLILEGIYFLNTAKIFVMRVKKEAGSNTGLQSIRKLSAFVIGPLQ